MHQLVNQCSILPNSTLCQRTNVLLSIQFITHFILQKELPRSSKVILKRTLQTHCSGNVNYPFNTTFVENTKYRRFRFIWRKWIPSQSYSSKTKTIFLRILEVDLHLPRTASYDRISLEYLLASHFALRLNRIQQGYNRSRWVGHREESKWKTQIQTSWTIKEFFVVSWLPILGNETVCKVS